MLYIISVTSITLTLLRQLPPFRNSDPGAHREYSCPIPSMLRVLVFIVGIGLQLLPRRLASNYACTRYVVTTVLHKKTNSPLGGFELTILAYKNNCQV